MSASAWDRAVEAAAKVLRCDYATQYDDTNVNWQEFADLARATVAAALPVLLEELADRIERGADGLVQTAREAVKDGGKGLARHASIKAEGVRCALGTVRGFAAEVTQDA